MLILSTTAKAASSTVVVSQVYVGTGDGEVKYRHQYIELFNLGTSTVNLQTWSVQYAVESANSWQSFPLSGSIAPGQYFLIRAGSASGTVELPLPDLIISLSLPFNVGKVAVVNDSTALDAGCPLLDDTRVVDRFGYGTSNCPEGTVAPLLDLSDLVAYIRKDGGCLDSDRNFQDFVLLTPVPHNRSSPRNFCGSPTTAGTRLFSVQGTGATTFQSTGGGSATSIGYARVETVQGSTPSGVAIFGLRQNNTLISETGVSTSSLITSGLMFVEVAGAVNTGIAIANPNNEDVTFSYEVTDINTLQTPVSGSIRIAANSQLARFLNEFPYGIRGVIGTMTFSTSAPVGITVLRGFTNERGEFLVSTLPIADPSIPASTLPAYVPYFAAGGGWRTELILVNPTGLGMSGDIAFFDPSGNPITVPIGTITASTAPYTVSEKRAFKFVLPNSGSIQVGSIRVIPISGERTPLAIGVFSYNARGIRVSEAAVMGLLGSRQRMYTETSGTAGAVGSIQSGVAIANADTISATVNLEAFRLDGPSTGLTTSLTLPVGGQRARFTHELFPSLPSNFRGVIRIDSPSSISVAGLRSRYNERSDFLIATVPVSEELASGTTPEVVFPHIVDSGGYTTQFIFFNNVVVQSSSGAIRFRTTGGQRLDLTLQ
jgi:hypothetical protein